MHGVYEEVYTAMSAAAEGDEGGGGNQVRRKDAIIARYSRQVAAVATG